MSVSFTAGGRQYIAVAIGMAGGSPRQVLRTITPEIRHPSRGHTPDVSELPR